MTHAMRACTQQLRRQRSAGFTLIEVLVALGIVAVALLAAGKASTSLVDNSSRFGRITLAQLCAENEMIKARLTKPMPPVGDSHSECRQSTHTFTQKISVRPTPNPSFRRMDVQIGDESGPILTLSTIVGKV